MIEGFGYSLVKLGYALFSYTLLIKQTFYFYKTLFSLFSILSPISCLSDKFNFMLQFQKLNFSISIYVIFVVPIFRSGS